MTKSKLQPILRTVLLLFALFGTATPTHAYIAAIDGIYYDISGTSAIVTYKYYYYGNGYSDYTGNITIPSTVTYNGTTYTVTAINDCAFRRSTGLTSVTIPNSVTSIGSYAFYGCSGLASVSIPNSVTTISEGMFAYCSGLTSVTIPNSVTSIGYVAFINCTGLTSVTIPNSVISIGTGAFEDCSGLTSIRIPNSVTTIGESAFRGCRGLTSVTIPNSVTTIYPYTFCDCDNLTDLTIGNSVNTIYRSAFVGCTKLMYVSCNAIMPPKYQPYDDYFKLFDDITYQNAILYVPDLTYNYYKQSDPWNKFMEIKAEPYSDSGVGFDAKVYPTSVRMDAGDENEECYFTFDNKQYQPLLVTGLEPNNIYSATYTRDWGADIPLKFYTSELKMVPEGGKMLTATAAQLMAETNMADEETMCGFDWRRLEGPDDYLGTRAYCPVYDGKMAGTLKNLSKDTWYKFRPFYKSNAGNVYYGDWVTFYSGDWGVEFDPVVYTYNSPAVSQTDATLQGVALRGSSEITEQGFEYWKSGTSNVKKVTASGERMSATVNGLDPETSYKFRAFVTADGKTVHGADVEFATRMGEHHVDNSLDVNADGVVNIADINVVINVILKGSNDNNCDVNGDGVVNISDINAIIAAILAN